MKPKTLDMEVAVSRYFNIRQCLIVPNVHWGMFPHEVDLCVLTPAGYATEVEIKISRPDLIKDKAKKHSHDCDMIKYLYFAIPEHMIKDIEHIPQRAGILVVRYAPPRSSYGITFSGGFFCRKMRDAEVYVKYKWAEHERISLMRLAAMRVWGLKEKLQKALLEAKT